jgi:hypothetical protein
MQASRQAEWDEARRRCRLTAEALAMAKELGLSPRSLVKNIPNPRERWKAPVEDWVRGLHLKRFGRRPPAASIMATVRVAPPPPAETAPPPASAPPLPAEEVVAPQPEPPSEVVNELEAAEEALSERAARGEVDPDQFGYEMERLERETPVSDGEVADDNRRMLQRRDGFRRFADLFAEVAAKLDFVQRIVLFGSVAAPLQKEVPRFARLRRARAAIWHECKDVDLAIWIGDLSRLRELKRAVSDATNQWQTIAARENLPGIPHHQVDVFVLEPGTDRYRGNLCHYGQCPKGKPECEVAGCGAQPFLRLYDDFEFDRLAPRREPAVVLFDRPAPGAKT